MIREWIQNIVVYLLCMSLVHHLIPDESYGKYIRLVTGMILILILVMPVIQWLDLEDVIDETFFQNQLQNFGQSVRSQIAGGAAAEENGVHLMPSGKGRGFSQVCTEGGCIVIHAGLSLRERIEIAVDAFLFAEGDVDVQPQCGFLSFHGKYLSKLSGSV